MPVSRQGRSFFFVAALFFSLSSLQAQTVYQDSVLGVGFEIPEGWTFERPEEAAGVQTSIGGQSLGKTGSGIFRDAEGRLAARLSTASDKFQRQMYKLEEKAEWFGADSDGEIWVALHPASKEDEGKGAWFGGYSHEDLSEQVVVDVYFGEGHALGGSYEAQVVLYRIFETLTVDLSVLEEIPGFKRIPGF